jgi:hypothetical protein
VVGDLARAGSSEAEPSATTASGMVRGEAAHGRMLMGDSAQNRLSGGRRGNVVAPQSPNWRAQRLQQHRLDRFQRVRRAAQV